MRRILATTKSELKTLIGKVAVRGRADTNPSHALSGGRRSPMVLGDRRELEGYITGPALPQVLDQDWRNSYANGGRRIFGWEPPPKRIRLG